MVDPNPTEMVNPSPASIEAFIARPDPNAIIMVNLLRYSKGGGRESYLRYAAVASGTVQARGGSFPFAAPVLEGDWDMVALVRYPRRAAYLDMQNDPAYVGAIPDRTAGLAARLLHPFHHPDGDPDDPFDIEVRGDDERFLVSLVRWADPSAPSNELVTPGGEVVLRLQRLVGNPDPATILAALPAEAPDLGGDELALNGPTVETIFDRGLDDPDWAIEVSYEGIYELGTDVLEDGAALDDHFGGLGGWISSALVRVGDMDLAFRPADPGGD